MNEIIRKPLFAKNKDDRKKRRSQVKRIISKQLLGNSEETVEIEKTVERSQEKAEGLQIVQEMTRAFIGTVEWYKTDWGGKHPHDEAVKEALSMQEWRREYVQTLEIEKVDWAHIAAVAEHNMNDGLALWVRIREAAENELESGGRAAKLIGNRHDAYAQAQFLAIRDSFADQWQPNGGIESAMIDMMALSFSMQMCWTTIAHRRTDEIHNNQEKELRRHENKGWKSPYQHEADAIDQAHRLADSYNRQFLRVLRQLRDLRRYSPIVIQNNGGQVNVGAQQLNVKD